MFIQEESFSDKLIEFQKYPNHSGQSKSHMLIKTSLDVQRVSKFPPISSSRRVSIYPNEEPILEEDGVERDTDSREGI